MTIFVAERKHVALTSHSRASILGDHRCHAVAEAEAGEVAQVAGVEGVYIVSNFIIITCIYYRKSKMASKIIMPIQ